MTELAEKKARRKQGLLERVDNLSYLHQAMIGVQMQPQASRLLMVEEILLAVEVGGDDPEAWMQAAWGHYLNRRQDIL